MEHRFVVEAKEFFFSVKSGFSDLRLGEKNDVFFRGGGFGLVVFHLVGGHSEGGAEVAGQFGFC